MFSKTEVRRILRGYSKRFTVIEKPYKNEIIIKIPFIRYPECLKATLETLKPTHLAITIKKLYLLQNLFTNEKWIVKNKLVIKKVKIIPPLYTIVLKGRQSGFSKMNSVSIKKNEIGVMNKNDMVIK